MTDHSFKQKRAMLAQYWKDQAANYGSRWTSDGDITSERFEMWLERVKRYETDEIRKAILLSRNSTDKFPPSLPEFLGLIQSTQRRKGNEPEFDPVAAQRLLSGRAGNARNRIVLIDGVYTHQVLDGEAWVTAGWQVNNPDGLLPAYKTK